MDDYLGYTFTKPISNLQVLNSSRKSIFKAFIDTCIIEAQSIWWEFGMDKPVQEQKLKAFSALMRI